MDYSQLAKTITRVTKNTVDVKKFDYGQKKTTLLIFSFMAVAILFYSHVFDTSLKRTFWNTVNHKQRLLVQYERNVYTSNRYGITYDKTFEDFYEGMFEFSIKEDIIKLVGFHFVLLLPIIFFIFKRAPLPVRFDRATQEIYTLHRGKYYSVTYKKAHLSFEKSHPQLDSDTHKGPLQITLYRLGDDKKLEIRMGGYPAFHNQNIMLFDWIKEFMDDETTAELFRNPRSHWCEWSLLAAQQLDEQKICEILDKS
jgi:hypothetical protein